jgi:hypothetical protein
MADGGNQGPFGDKNGKNHGPFGQNLLIPHEHWCYGLNLPPHFTCSARRQSRWFLGVVLAG